jgi:biopolymer transport protein ExbD
MPLTHLFFPQRIYVPLSWLQLNRVCQNHIIQHELAHVRRYDNWVKLLQMLVQALYFFHPLVYILNKKMDLYREMACDDVSISYSRISHRDYSRFLTEIAENAIWTPAMYQSASALIRQKSALINRIKYQMQEVTMSSLSRKKLVRISLMIMLGILAFSWYFSSATSVSASAKAVLDQPIVKVTVNESNEIFIDDNKIASENFKTVMEKRTREINETAVIELNFNPRASMQRVFSIQHQLQELDLLRVIYTNEAGKGLNLHLPRPDMAEKFNQIDKKDILALSLKSDGSVTANDLVIEKSKIEKYINESLKKNEYLIVAIYTDPDAQYEMFVDLLDRVHLAICCLLHASSA